MIQRGQLGLIALAAAAGCGGFENAPLGTGTVRGALSQVDASALVAVIGSAARGTVSPDGTFEVQGVPAGDWQLFIVATSQTALKASATVRAGQVTQLGTLAPEAGAFIDARLSQPSLAQVAAVTTDLTPFTDERFSSQAHAQIGPLPTGCYTVVARAEQSDASFETSSDVCVHAGERQSVTVSFGAPPSGCLSSRCPVGLTCAPDGSGGTCVACLANADCAAGTCQAHECVGLPRSCTKCESDARCGTAIGCLDLEGDGPAVCVQLCGTGSTCPSGFQCTQGQCLPSSAVGGCVGYRRLGGSCAQDIDCAAVPGGVCASQKCTVACTTSRDCPDEFSCANGFCTRSVDE